MYQPIFEIVTVRFRSGEAALLGYEAAVVVVGVGDRFGAIAPCNDLIGAVVGIGYRDAVSCF